MEKLLVCVFFVLISTVEVESESNNKENLKNTSFYTSLNLQKKQSILFTNNSPISLIGRKKYTSFSNHTISIPDTQYPHHLPTAFQVKTGKYFLSSLDGIADISYVNILSIQFIHSSFLQSLLESERDAELVISKNVTKLALVPSINNKLILANISTSLGLKLLNSDPVTYNNITDWKASDTIKDITSYKVAHISSQTNVNQKDKKRQIIKQINDLNPLLLPSKMLNTAHNNNLQFNVTLNLDLRV